MVTQTTMGQPASGETPPIGPTAERRAAFWKRAFAACSESKAELERELRKLQMEMPDYKQCCDLREKAERELAEANRLVAFWQKSSAEWKASRDRALAAPPSATATFTREDAAKIVERKAQALADEPNNAYVEGDTGAMVWTNREAEWQAILLDELAEEFRASTDESSKT